MAGWTVAAAAAAVLFGGVTWRTPWPQVIEGLGVSLVFSAAIVPIIALTMPRLFPAVCHRVPFPVDWVVLFVVLAGIAMIGSALAITVLWAIGYVPASQVLQWFLGSVRLSIIMTLIFGVSGTIVEALQSQLREATLALRTKERDEADARRAAAESQLASLESRVNPHFLFNTLNSIAALTHTDPGGAEKMTSQLSSLMRSSLDGGSTPLVTVEEELGLVRDYLDIERVRFGERLRFAIDVDEALKKTPIPRLSLQTIVENSVKFAVSPRREGGAIAIRGSAAPGAARLEVQDDGPGFDASEAIAGHGLALVRSRLAAIFGGAATLRIESQPGRTTVTIEVPWNHKDHEGHKV